MIVTYIYVNIYAYSHILFKTPLIGDSNLGKSSIILRYTEHTFNEKLINSIEVDFKSKKFTIEDKIVKLQIGLILYSSIIIYLCSEILQFKKNLEA